MPQDMTDQPPTRTTWRVAPASAFRVDAPDGSVPLTQIDRSRFRVDAAFEFDDPRVTGELVEQMVANGTDEAAAQAAVENARTYSPSEDDPTDLASIPPFMRWFENTYGSHTLAAIIHDRLIGDVPNSGALGSDALADLFFLRMMDSAGVPRFKRWIMWAAVALRTRWAAGGARRSAIGLWIALALTGISAFVVAVGTTFADWQDTISPLALIGFSVVLPIVSAPLWGQQRSASIVAAAAALWILPAAVFALIGFGFYSAIEHTLRRLNLD